jgi:hypothetical protein
VGLKEIGCDDEGRSYWDQNRNEKRVVVKRVMNLPVL